MTENCLPRPSERIEEALEALEAFVSLDQSYVELVSLLDRGAAFRGMLDLVPEMTGMDVAFIAENRGSDEIVIDQMSGARTSALRGLLIPRGLGLGGKAFELGEVQWVDDYPSSPSISHHFDGPVRLEGLRAVIAAPIRHGERTFGILYVARRRPVVFGGRAIHAVEAAARQMAAAAIAAERAQTSATVAVHEERRRLALELHDSVGAMLFAISAGIGDLGERLDTDPAVRARLLDLERQAVEASTMLRESLRALSATPQEIGLGVALRRDCSAFERDAGIPARLVILGDLPALEQSQVKALTDTGREALLNVRKHAQARSVAIMVSADRNGVTVAVVDDGIGLQDNCAGGGLGLEACAERLGRVGGFLSIDGNDEGGVTLRAWVPA